MTIINKSLNHHNDEETEETDRKVARDSCGKDLEAATMGQKRPTSVFGCKTVKPLRSHLATKTTSMK